MRFLWWVTKDKLVKEIPSKNSTPAQSSYGSGGGSGYTGISQAARQPYQLVNYGKGGKPKSMDMSDPDVQRIMQEAREKKVARKNKNRKKRAAQKRNKAARAAAAQQQQQQVPVVVPPPANVIPPPVNVQPPPANIVPPPANNVVPPPANNVIPPPANNVIPPPANVQPPAHVQPPQPVNPLARQLAFLQRLHARQQAAQAQARAQAQQQRALLAQQKAARIQGYKADALAGQGAMEHKEKADAKGELFGDGTEKLLSAVDKSTAVSGLFGTQGAENTGWSAVGPGGGKGTDKAAYHDFMTQKAFNNQYASGVSDVVGGAAGFLENAGGMYSGMFAALDSSKDKYERTQGGFNAASGALGMMGAGAKMAAGGMYAVNPNQGTSSIFSNPKPGITGISDLKFAGDALDVAAGGMATLGKVAAAGGQFSRFRKDIRGGKFKVGNDYKKGRMARAGGRGIQTLTGIGQSGVATATGASKLWAQFQGGGAINMASHAGKVTHGLSVAGAGVGVAAGSFDMIRGGWNVYNSTRKRSLLKRKKQNKSAEEQAALEHLREIHRNKQKRGGVKMATGAAGVVGSALVLSGFGALPALGIGAAIGLGTLGHYGFKKYRQHKRDQAARYNSWKDKSGAQIRAAKIAQEDTKINAAANASKFNLFAKAKGAWARHKKKKFTDKDDQYFLDKKAKYTQSDHNRLNSWRHVNYDISKSTEAKAERSRNTAAHLMEMNDSEVMRSIGLKQGWKKQTNDDGSLGQNDLTDAEQVKKILEAMKKQDT